MANFHFLRPAWLGLLLPFALLGYLNWRRGNLATQWETTIAPHLLPRLIVRGTQRQLLSPFWISVILSPLVAIALAGPSWQRGESPFAEDTGALVIAVDLSESMAGRDLQPSRLQRARDRILQLAEARGDARTALLAYAGTAHTVLPLTNDRAVLLHYLDALQIGMLPRRGKAPEAVLPLVREVLAGAGPGSTLLIVGDGASNASAAAFESLAEDDGLQLLVWGMAKRQADIEADRERGLASDALPLQEAQLRAIAEAGQGRFVAATADDSDVATLLRVIDRHYQLSDDSSRPWIDGGYYLLFVIVPLFLLWFRVGWVLRW